jgi:hypothetical protein
MVDSSYLPAIKETIKQNEIGNGSPYALSYARKGKSGASFGCMQGDTNVSALARSTLQRVLADATAAASARILAAVSKPLPGGNPLSAADTTLVNAALAAPPGKALVDAMDAQLLADVLGGLDACLAAAASRNMEIQPEALLYIPPWINMSGPPALLKKWLGGQPALGLAPPPPPDLSVEEIASYLQATAYFQANPRNFVHYQECVSRGAALLP